MIYLKHAIHGVKVTSLELEAAADEQHGWTRFDPSKLENVSTGEPKMAAPKVAPPVYNEGIPGALLATSTKKVK